MTLCAHQITPGYDLEKLKKGEGSPGDKKPAPVETQVFYSMG